jgi:polar amino acid transport system permease protein
MPRQSDIRAKAAGWSLLLVSAAGAAAAGLAIAGSIEWQEFLEYLPRLGWGLVITLFLAGSSFLCGFLMAFGLLMAAYLSPAASRGIGLYQNIIRYTPLLAQLYLVYYGAGEISAVLDTVHLWWLFREPMFCVLLVFLINTTAYQSFILMGCVANVGKGQREAGLALGLKPYPLMLKVLLPQALRFSVKPLGNELVGMIKASSVASVVTVFDLLGETQAIYADTFNLGYFLIAAAIYVILVEATRIMVDRLSERLGSAPAR